MTVTFIMLIVASSATNPSVIQQKLENTYLEVLTVSTNFGIFHLMESPSELGESISKEGSITLVSRNKEFACTIQHVKPSGM